MLPRSFRLAVIVPPPFAQPLSLREHKTHSAGKTSVRTETSSPGAAHDGQNPGVPATFPRSFCAGAPGAPHRRSTPYSLRVSTVPVPARGIPEANQSDELVCHPRGNLSIGGHTPRIVSSASTIDSTIHPHRVPAMEIDGGKPVREDSSRLVREKTRAGCYGHHTFITCAVSSLRKVKSSTSTRRRSF